MVPVISPHLIRTLNNRHLKPSFISVSQACEYFNRELLRLSGITRTSDSIIVLLEIPPISINDWNTCKSCDKSEEASNHDINQQIDAVNSLIRTFNQENSGISSPRFGLDLEIERKNKNKTARKSFNFKLYLDGVHPSSELSKLWMLRILRCVGSNKLYKL